MNNEQCISANILHTFPLVDEARVDAMLSKELAQLDKKIVVLDDDPTGVQAVHGVSVYTNWNKDTLLRGFAEQNSMFFILTNTRGCTVAQTTTAHAQIVHSIAHAMRHSGKDSIIISRSDSTLRGHYPLETTLLREGLEAELHQPFDGEIIYPFFKEGGRFTINDVHYVKEGDTLVPAGLTEFAKDRSFGYTASNLKEWCEEKSGGVYRAADVTSITLEKLRGLRFDDIENKLCASSNFHKIIVNAVDYVDVKIFAIAFCRAVGRGKRFIFRSAAAITKVLGNVPDKALLTGAELVAAETAHGGVVLIGSHTQKTTTQLEELKKSHFPLEFLEFDVHHALDANRLENEVCKTVAHVESCIRQGRSVVIYTSRTLLAVENQDKDVILTASVNISQAVASIIGRLTVQPSFIVAKGGITSSDVGTKALHVIKATVMGQIQPGIPVWMTGPESTFPHMAYVIFPGNVGDTATLRQVVETLVQR